MEGKKGMLQVFKNIFLACWRKKEEYVNNDLILCLFCSKTAGTNPAFKDYC